MFDLCREHGRGGNSAPPVYAAGMTSGILLLSVGRWHMVSVEVLRSVPFFAGVSSQTLHELAGISEERTFRVGEELWQPGDEAHWLYVVREGEIDISYVLQNGRKCIVDTVVGGELTGWSALLEPYRFTALAVARTAGWLLCIQAAAVRQLCERDPVLGYRLAMQVARAIASRLEGARLQLIAMS